MCAASHRPTPKMEVGLCGFLCLFFVFVFCFLLVFFKKLHFQKKLQIVISHLIFGRNLHFRICALLRIAQLRKWRSAYVVFCVCFLCLFFVHCFLFIVFLFIVFLFIVFCFVFLFIVFCFVFLFIVFLFIVFVLIFYFEIFIYFAGIIW